MAVAVLLVPSELHLIDWADLDVIILSVTFSKNFHVQIAPHFFSLLNYIPQRGQNFGNNRPSIYNIFYHQHNCFGARLYS